MHRFLQSRRLLPRAADRNGAKPRVNSNSAVRSAGPSDRYVLGISALYHNSAAALIRDGKVVAAAEEERFTRVKNDRRYPANAINYCLEEAGINQDSLSAVAFYDDSALTFERLVHSVMAVDRESASRMWDTIVPEWVCHKLQFPRMLREHLQYQGKLLQGVHHRSHAASCFYPSPFESAAILTVDGVGEWATATIGRGQGSDVEILKEMRFPDSLGLLYSAFTYFTGFKVNSGEYKMMGLAPYGRPVYAQKILDNVVHVNPDGSIELNMEYFSFLKDTKTTSEKFDELFGGPRRAPESRITRREIDIASSIQAVTEEIILKMARHAQELTGERNLCLAGGVALNCVANGRLLREGIFDDLWIQPAAGDSGCALGVALDAWHTYFGEPREADVAGSQQSGSYLGPAFSDDEIRAFLDTHGYPYRHMDDADRQQFLSEQIVDGKVIGHFADRLEFGPRSLGARSIVGDARNTEMQVNLNLRIKYRESFRPFAPAVLRDRVSDYFELDRDSPYMLIVAPVKAERRLPFDHSLLANSEDLLPIVREPRSDLPAITHVDYSARVQTIRPEHHATFYKLVKQFEKITDCGVVVNTSFNVRGEPIVCTPFDAYRCFMRTEMDVLALGNCILVKQDQPEWPEPRGEGLENEDVEANVRRREAGSAELKLKRVFEQSFWPIAEQLSREGKTLIRAASTGEGRATTWVPVAEPEDWADIFEVSDAVQADSPDPVAFADAVLSRWQGKEAAQELASAVRDAIAVGLKHRSSAEETEHLSESVYVMF
ncbi:carbamoyltransferase [Roseiconus nitratireducens]|uniref:Carbamoyltransferase n=2 Tax=Roseiconus nitratireducens TaxID=2605748 RepID=A0A5M6DJD8_9BACT|nr:carbamoyltransferase [Roseiconus nitratireducens]